MAGKAYVVIWGFPLAVSRGTRAGMWTRTHTSIALLFYSSRIDTRLYSLALSNADEASSTDRTTQRDTINLFAQ